MKGNQKNQLTDYQQIAWLTLSRDSRFSVSQKHQLLRVFSDPVEIYQTHYGDLCSLLSTKPNFKKERSYQAQLNVGIARDLEWLENSNNHIVCWGDTVYPLNLAQICDPPVCLFVSGKLSLLTEPIVSIVGSRRPTPVGSKVAATIAADLATLGIIVCSGMALGIDAISHTAALNENEPTIAVMGCGLDIISPARHRSLFEKIAEQGLVMSEYPLGYPASKYTFPQRNRIVSGLSYGVVIVEAADKSGTLITARLAMEQNRDVFVVPGSSVNPQYIGSHRLIKQGAILTTDAQDILVELSSKLHRDLNIVSLEAKKPVASVNNSEKQEREFPLLTFIDYHPTSIEQIILGSGLTASEVSSMLLVLEIEGKVAMTPDGSYLRVC
ncbi:MAG: DNA-processing protein DprA [Acidiferrobacterales bacterium]|nr:DNA-processing protein DprA [Acidiferrobacterales bacterium]